MAEEHDSFLTGLAFNSVLPIGLRQVILVRLLLESNFHRLQSLLSRVVATPSRVIATRRELLKRYWNTRDAEQRAVVVNCIIYLDSNAGSGERIAEDLTLFLKDESPAVRKVAMRMLAREGTTEAFEWLEMQLGQEDDLNLQNLALAAILRVYKRQMYEAIRVHEFDQAEAIGEQLMALHPNSKTLRETVTNLIKLREQHYDYQRRVEKENKQSQADHCVVEAAAKMVENDFDAASDYLTLALKQMPDHPEARKLLPDLPKLRAEFSRILLEKNTTDRQKQVENFRAEAMKVMSEDGDLDKALELVLRLLSIEPLDPWGNQTLTKIPTLQEERRTAAISKEKTGKIQKLINAQAALEEHLKKEELEQAEKVINELIALEPSNVLHAHALQNLRERRETQLEANQAAEFFERASRALDQGDFVLTEKTLQSLRVLADKGDQFEKIIGRLPEIKRHRDEALAKLEKDQRNNRRKLKQEEVEGLFKAADFPAVFPLLRELLAIDPLNPEYEELLKKAHALDDQSRLKKEAEEQRQAVDLALVNVKQAMDRGDYSKAEELLQPLFIFDFERGRVDKVMEEVRAATQKHKANAVLIDQRKKEERIKLLRADIETHFKELNYKEAVTRCSELLSLLPDDEQTINLLQRARHLLQESVAVRQIEAGMVEVKKLLEEKRFDEAQTRLNGLIALHPSHKPGMDLLSQLPALKQKHVELQKIHDVAQNRKEADALLSEASNLFERGDLGEVSAKVRRALALDPDNDRAQDLLKRVSEMESLLPKKEADREKKEVSEVPSAPKETKPAVEVSQKPAEQDKISFTRKSSLVPKPPPVRS